MYPLGLRNIDRGLGLHLIWVRPEGFADGSTQPRSLKLKNQPGRVPSPYRLELAEILCDLPPNLGYHDTYVYQTPPSYLSGST